VLALQLFSPIRDEVLVCPSKYCCLFANNEKFAPIFNKEKKEELKKTAINNEEKKPEQPAPVIKISPPVTNKNCIPYNDGLTPEVISKNWHKIRPCDPNEIITKKESRPNKFNDLNFKGYY
jgi:hypothetical protein